MNNYCKTLCVPKINQIESYLTINDEQLGKDCIQLKKTYWIGLKTIKKQIKLKFWIESSLT